MITAPRPYLAAEDPIGPSGITENERYQHGHPDQHEDLAVLRRSRLPDRDALRHDIGIHADTQPGIGQPEQYQHQKERPGVLLLPEAAYQERGDGGDRDRHRRDQDDIRPGEPTLRVL